MANKTVAIPSPTFELTDPLKAQRNDLINTLYQNVRMYALDNTRGLEEPLRVLAVDVAISAIGDVLHVLDDDYYIMKHNAQSRELPNLSGELSEAWEVYYGEINS